MEIVRNKMEGCFLLRHRDLFLFKYIIKCCAKMVESVIITRKEIMPIPSQLPISD